MFARDDARRPHKQSQINVLRRGEFAIQFQHHTALFHILPKEMTVP